MTDDVYIVMGLGNAYDFVIKNINEPETYGTFQGDRESMKEFIEKVNRIIKENEELKTELFEARKELLWATSDEVDRVLYYEDEVEELRKEIFND